VKNNDEHIVFIGGGTMGVIARPLKKTHPNLSFILTMTDSGGCSGALRRDRGGLPPGDIRQVMQEMADDNLEAAWKDMLSFRFPYMGSQLDERSIGNYLLTALTERCGNIVEAIEIMSRHFGIRAKILPVTTSDSDLYAQLDNYPTQPENEILRGEFAIDKRSPRDPRKIVKVWLSPQATISPEAHYAIMEADKKVIGPGDHITSIVPILLVSGVSEAIKLSKAKKGGVKLIYVVNLMSKKAETDGYTASHFVKSTLKFLNIPKFDAVICNTGIIPEEILRKYRRERAHQIEVDEKELINYTDQIILDDFVLVDSETKTLHHSSKVAQVIANL
jgi:uncharacterized cofD-like protein